MPASWHSLYLKSAQAATVASALSSSLEGLGYLRYDPFPGGAGTPSGLTQYIRLFVEALDHGLVRVLGNPDPACIPGLSQVAPVLHLWLDGDSCGLTAFREGQSDESALEYFLPPGRSVEALRQVEQGKTPAGNADHPDSGTELQGIPLDVAQLARDRNVNPAQANQLINKLTGQLFGKLNAQSGGEAGTMQRQAQALLASSGSINWNTEGARRVTELARFLDLPAAWRTPDFDEVREAYQVARRLQRSPSARLMPDEQAALKRVPNALDYLPVYVGR